MTGVLIREIRKQKYRWKDVYVRTQGEANQEERSQEKTNLLDLGLLDSRTVRK